MNQRVNHGACRNCGRPVLYQGAELCSPTCQDQLQGCPLCNNFLEPGQELCLSCDRKLPTNRREILVLDSETALVEPGRQAPPLACVSWATVETYGLVHHTEARPLIVNALEGDFLLVGHNVAFDFTVWCAMWPELIPLIFQVYAADRVTDTMLREKLVDIATGTKYFEYNLGVVAKRRLGIQVDKSDEWRLRFGELISYPLDQWPEAPKRYAVTDSVATVGVYQEQEKDRKWLVDEFRQARAAFWIQLMSVWGMHTDEAGVREFARKTQQKYDAIAEELVAAGLMRVKKTKKKATKLIETTVHKNTKVARQRMEEAWAKRPGTAEPEYTTKGISLSADNCDRSGDPLLEKYAEHSSIGTLISTFIPLLQQGIHTPIHPNFDTLLVTGRTSSSPNVQNLPTETGVRECFAPRPGKVFAVADYSAMELRTWSQICLKLFEQSKLAEALNSGLDPHTKIASLILDIPYEQALQEYREDPKGRIYLPRQSGKVANFGYPGGLGIARFVVFARSAYGVILTEEEARNLKEYWKQAWPEAKLYADWISAQGESGNIQLEHAFVGRFRGGLSYTEGSNTLFQGLAADCAKAAGFLISRACYADPNSVLYGSRIVDFIHDEFLVETDDTPRAHDVAMELARLMKVGADQYLVDVPSVVEPLLARRWSKKAKPVHGSDGRLVPWDLAA